ncbi:MAG: hypothetical protein GY727_16370 [Gammaproteobacteria bacterium]|nr:hypothetical protein [Gammaproteobacteria bacterium]MCP4089215.1 hypothetical protein [Gammaproteobacteria bacterium]MCP4276761.1 hypothetical protein [Gammaproteobacteria bacterium]MCP4830604.1 hypothetical protein [Gammaproteobacteria bacterium]MCP4928413.1 hypothetical protein [Gammaproteobacteria bacterium]
MAELLHCWRCGADLSSLNPPLSRMDECPECAIHLHVCRMCSYFDAAVTRSCREDDAEDVKEKERPNFCDYFKPSADAFNGDIAAANQSAQAQLGALFGEASDGDAADVSSSNPAEDLFK